MYERSAIVLERYFENMCQFNKKGNLKSNYNNFRAILDELVKYQSVEQEEEQKIEEFDKVANEIRRIQKAQEKLSKSNIELEEERKRIFIDCIDENPDTIKRKLDKIEETLLENNKELIELKNELLQNISELRLRQQERNKTSKQKRVIEANYLQRLEKSTQEVEKIDLEDIKQIKTFINTEDCEEIEKELIDLMLQNGNGEKIGFDEDVIKNSVQERIDIAKRELECYILSYEKMTKLLAEINNDNLRIGKYQKAIRDLSVKIAFFEAEKKYIVSFLDNERITAVNGFKIHKKMMQEACEKFELDIAQIDKLYELLLKEISGKATRKAYKELYNQTYLHSIEDKEKKFEKEVNNIKVNMGTIFNSNYWRIEEIKNIYEVFQKEVSEKFEKDLSEYSIEENEETDEDANEEADEDTETINAEMSETKSQTENKKKRNKIINIKRDEKEENQEEYEDRLPKALSIKKEITKKEGYENINNYDEDINDYDKEEDYKDTDDYDEDEDYKDTDDYDEDEDYKDTDDYDEDEDYEDTDDYDEDEDYKDTDDYDEDEDYEDTDDYDEDEDYEDTDDYDEDEDYEDTDDYDEDEDYEDTDDYDKTEETKEDMNIKDIEKKENVKSKKNKEKKATEKKDKAKNIAKKKEKEDKKTSKGLRGIFKGKKS